MIREDILLVLSGETSDISESYTCPRSLDTENYQYYLSLDEFDVYNSIPNINKSRNSLKIKPGKDKTELTIVIEPGAYEITQIHSAIITELINHGIEKPDESFRFLPNTATSKLYIDIAKDWTLSFNVNNSIASILGFKKTDTFAGPKICVPDKIVMINTVDTLFFYCNIIEPSHVNDKQRPLLYVHPINVPPGYKMTPAAGKEPTFISTNANVLDYVRVWVLDRNDKYVDFRGEKLTITLKLRKTRKHIKKA